MAPHDRDFVLSYSQANQASTYVSILNIENILKLTHQHKPRISIFRCLPKNRKTPQTNVPHTLLLLSITVIRINYKPLELAYCYFMSFQTKEPQPLGGDHETTHFQI